MMLVRSMPGAAPTACAFGELAELARDPHRASSPWYVAESRGQRSQCATSVTTLGIIATALTGAVACAGDSAPEPGWMERDSAGITIVENTTPAWTDATQWRVDSVPSLDIGSMDGEVAYLLHRIRPVRRLRNGSIAVPSSGTNEIRVFSASGEYLRTIGRRGDGPGELVGLWWVEELPGDSILAVDLGHDRITVFGPDGEHVRDHRFERPDGSFEPSLLGRFTNGRILGYGGGGAERVSASEAGFSRSQRTYFTVDETGGDPRVIGDFVEQTAGSGPGVVWFAPRARQAVQGERWYFAPGDVFEVHVYDSSGGLRRIVRLEREPRATTQAERQIYLDSVNAELDRLQAPPVVRERMGNPEFYPIVPPTGPIVVDAHGALWVAPYSDPYGLTGGPWTVFDPDGRLLGIIDMPDGLTIDQIGDDFVLGRWTDELDVEHVRMYPLFKPGA